MGDAESNPFEMTQSLIPELEQRKLEDFGEGVASVQERSSVGLKEKDKKLSHECMVCLIGHMMLCELLIFRYLSSALHIIGVSLGLRLCVGLH
jgi:hypothetical protein